MMTGPRARNDTAPTVDPAFRATSKLGETLRIVVDGVGRKSIEIGAGHRLHMSC